MTANVGMNTNRAVPPKMIKNIVTVQGAVGGLFTGESLRTIPAMWYMARPSADRMQETKMLPSTKRIAFTMADSKIKATRMTVFTAITGSTTPSSMPTLKTTNPGLSSGWRDV